MRRNRPLVTFEDYTFRACERITRCGGNAKRLSTAPVADDVVLLDARLEFERQQVQLDIFEVVKRSADGGAERFRYRYRCWLTGGPVFRHERDPVGHPEMPVHKHLHNGTRVSCDEVSLDWILDNFWDEVDREQRRRDRERERTAAAV